MHSCYFSLFVLNSPVHLPISIFILHSRLASDNFHVSKMIDIRSTIRLLSQAKSSVDHGPRFYMRMNKSKHFACEAQFHSGINMNLHKHDQFHGFHCDNANYSRRVRDLLVCI